MSADLVGIYIVRNMNTFRVYVGQTANFKTRKQNHFNTLRNRKHYNKQLQRSFDKHGEGAFEFQVVFACSKETLTEHEDWILESYRNSPGGVYNQKGPADAPMRGHSPSQETREKQRKAQLGRTVPEHVRAKMSASSKGQQSHMKGKKHSVETIAKMKASQSGANNRNFEKPWTKDQWEAQSGAKNKRSKPVERVDPSTGECVEFANARDAKRSMNLSTHASISRACRGLQNIAHGFMWKYADLQ